jgi:hypothetical protein
MNSLNAAPPDAAAVPHSTPLPVDLRTCPDVPVPPPAVSEPESVAPESVSPEIVVTVAPDAIDVDPSVGAEYPDTVPQESVPEPSFVRYFPELDAWSGRSAVAAVIAVVAPVPPLAIAIVVPVQVPEVIVPRVVMLSSPVYVPPATAANVEL